MVNKSIDLVIIRGLRTRRGNKSNRAVIIVANSVVIRITNNVVVKIANRISRVAGGRARDAYIANKRL